MPPKLVEMTRVTRSSVRAAAAPPMSAPLETEVSPPPSPSPAPARKKRKTASTAAVKTESAPALLRAASPRAPPQPFSLEDGVAHLSAVDARFDSLFKRIPCRPFVEAAGRGPAAGAAQSVAAKVEAGTLDPSDKSPEELVQGDIDPFRTLVTSIIGQQVSWMAARSITRRFVELFCGPTEGHEPRRGQGPFPTREQVAAANVPDLKGVGCSTRKAEYVIELAQHFVSGRLTDDLLLNGTDEQVAEALIAVRGIGRWTVDMFLIFTLRRPDVLPVGDLGVQKGLLRWVLAAHGALPPPPPPKTPKKQKSVASSVPDTPTPSAMPLAPADSTATLVDLDESSQSTSVETPTPSTPSKSAALNDFRTPSKFPSTPGPPPATPSASANPTLPPPVSDSILATPNEWDAACAARAAPLPDGLTVSMLRSRLAGKKAKGGVYLLPNEMEALTDAWRPYRSLGVYYTWSMAGETPSTSADKLAA